LIIADPKVNKEICRQPKIPDRQKEIKTINNNPLSDDKIEHIKQMLKQVAALFHIRKSFTVLQNDSGWIKPGYIPVPNLAYH